MMPVWISTLPFFFLHSFTVATHHQTASDKNHMYKIRGQMNSREMRTTGWQWAVIHSAHCRHCLQKKKEELHLYHFFLLSSKNFHFLISNLDIFAKRHVGDKFKRPKVVARRRNLVHTKQEKVVSSVKFMILVAQQAINVDEHECVCEL